MDYDNAASTQNIGDWYNLFSGNNVAEKPKVIAPSSTGALGELMIYSEQVKAYAEYVIAMANTIEQDIRRDISADVGSVFSLTNVPTDIEPAAVTAAPQPLAVAVANRDKLVECGEKLASTVKSIDSILARVKIKEQ